MLQKRFERVTIDLDHIRNLNNNIEVNIPKIESDIILNNSSSEENNIVETVILNEPENTNNNDENMEEKNTEENKKPSDGSDILWIP